MDDLTISEHFPATDDGWRLHLSRSISEAHFDPSRRPVVIVPGYGMNGFIFGFHPAGTSLVQHLAHAGLEVWVANLRAQGKSRPSSPEAPPPSLRNYAETDLRVAITHALSTTRTKSDRVDLLGASLGGSIAYAHLALEPRPRVGTVVAVGSPLKWRDIPPILRLPFRSPGLLSLVRIGQTRRLANAALPLALRLPPLLSMYLNAKNVDLSAAARMIETVEDPHPSVNTDIAKWIGASDMVLRGVNVTDAMRARREPLLIVLGNRDGIVPAATALSAREVWGGSDVSVLRVGDDSEWYAHADLFVGRRAPERVFAPIARWLCERHLPP